MRRFLLIRFLLLLALSACLFLLGNNALPLTDQDEVFFALSAKEMVQHNEWLTPYIFNQPQFEKPILIYWFAKVAFAVFGDTPFAARFFPAVFAILGVLGTYALGLLGFANERRAFLGALVLCTSVFYMGMGKVLFADMIFSVLILYALLSFYLAYTNSSYKRLGIFSYYSFIALATLTKGPLGFIIPELIIVVFLFYCREISFLKSHLFVLGTLLALLIAVPWYWYQYVQHGDAFLHEFFYNSHWRRFIEAEHPGNDHWFFYPVAILTGLFPWTIFLIASIGNLYKRLKVYIRPFEYFVLSWILVVFILFQIAHSKLTSYVLPMFPALALLVANYIDEKWEEREYEVIKKWLLILIGFLVLTAVSVLACQKFYEPFIPTLMPGYWLSGALIALAGVALCLWMKEKIRQTIGLLSLSVIPFFVAVYMITPYIEPYLSTRDACYYVPSQSIRQTTILTSKHYARGVRFYTGQDVAVFDMNGTNFFSPHPVPVLNDGEKLLAFLKKQRQSYAVLSKSGLEDLRKFEEEIRWDVLHVSGQKYVLRIVYKAS